MDTEVLVVGSRYHLLSKLSEFVALNGKKAVISKGLELFPGTRSGNLIYREESALDPAEVSLSFGRDIYFIFELESTPGLMVCLNRSQVEKLLAPYLQKGLMYSNVKAFYLPRTFVSDGKLIPRGPYYVIKIRKKKILIRNSKTDKRYWIPLMSTRHLALSN